jgi:CheY-like chemotaxis protein
LQLERVQLDTIINTALEMVRPQVQERKHHLEVALSTVPIILHADPVRLTQVLVNLLDNALKYTDPGGRIWLTADVDSSIATIRVRDSGIGIAPEMLPRIFDLFEQAHTGIEQSRGGLGVGLTIVRRLVYLHSGTIAVSSRGPGLGCEFTVRLPLAVDIPEIETKLSSLSFFSATDTNRIHLRILVVDDVAVTASSTASVLRLWQHEVETCSDGFSALARAQEFRPDVILTDLGLPRMNGYQFAEEVRRIAGLGAVTLIAVSGYGQAVDQKRSRDAGFWRHLVKPVSLQELYYVLQSVPCQEDRHRDQT